MTASSQKTTSILSKNLFPAAERDSVKPEAKEDSSQFNNQQAADGFTAQHLSLFVLKS